LGTRIYQKENNHKPGKLLLEVVRDIWSSRFLSRQLTERDIKAQYRQSYLGILWMFITPLATAAIWIFLNLSGTVKLSDTGMPYPLYAFSGTLIWSIIRESINSPTASTNAARGIMSKINFPKEALIVSGMYKLLFNSSVKLSLLVVFIFIFGIGFHWSLLFVPFLIIAAVFTGTAIGLLITPIGMLYNDVGKAVNMALGFLMFVTPVVYEIPESGIMRSIMELNPFTPFLVVSRNMITGDITEYLPYLFVVLFLTIPLLLVGLIFYRISIPIIVERSNA
jgi:lipopolysaccharide transport system permease protein